MYLGHVIAVACGNGLKLSGMLGLWSLVLISVSGSYSTLLCTLSPTTNYVMYSAPDVLTV